MEVTAEIWRCPCGGPLDLELLPLASRPDLAGEGVWRYLPWLPVRRALSLGECRTPLVRLGDQEGAPVLKLEGALPSGSFKDRGAAVLVSWLAERGVRAVIEDSSGNAGAALAAYCARAGLACELYVPEDASPEKIVQAEAYGARVVPVPGDREAATSAAMDAADAGRTYATHLWHPLFQAGTETFAFEVWEQLGRRVPEMVIAPVGAGSLLLGVWNGFRRLRAAGLVATVPRLFGVQAASCAPLAEAAIGPRAKPLPSGVAGPAEGIRVTDPPRGPAVVAATRESGGSIVSVADEFIWSAHRALAKAGVYAEPTAAVGFAGHRALRSEGMIDPAETAVVAITGLGLKTTSAIRSRRESEREVLA